MREVIRIDVEENVYSQRVSIKFTLPWLKGERGCAEVVISDLRPAQIGRLIGDLRGAQEKQIAHLQESLARALGKTS